jgi:hypothetical protein
VDEKDYREVLQALDRALMQFGERPTEAGFDTAIYDELRKARETLIRAQRDLRDPKVKKRDSRSPLGSS